MNAILEKLSGGDLRSEGKSADVALEIIDQPALLKDLAPGLGSEDKVIRGRVCMTMEIISRQHPELLEAVAPQLIALASTDHVAQVRWHLAEIFGNVPLGDRDVEQVVPILLGYLEDKSKIVKYCAVQSLGILGGGSAWREEIVASIRGLRGVSKGIDKIVAKTLRDLGDVG